MAARRQQFSSYSAAAIHTRLPEEVRALRVVLQHYTTHAPSAALMIPTSSSISRVIGGFFALKRS